MLFRSQVKAILDMVLSLLGVHSGHYLHLFNTLYFMEKERGRHMFAALGDNKDVQLKWLEKEYQRHPEFILSEGKKIVIFGTWAWCSNRILSVVLVTLLFFFFFLLVATKAYHVYVCKTMLIIPMSTSWYIYICFPNASFS